jgi:hypothetical protein
VTPLKDNITFCKRPYCVPFRGTCELINYDCSTDNNTRQIDNTSCETVTCDDKEEKCVINDNECLSLIAIIIGLSAGAVGGIAAAAFIAAMLVGGGAAAAAHGTAAQDNSVTSTNPTFESNNMAGASPLN